MTLRERAAPQQPERRAAFPSRRPRAPRTACRRFIHGALLWLACLAWAPAVALELSECWLTAAEGRVEVGAQCGRLAVPLNPDDAGGDTIELAVAVVPALTPEPEPDPLTLLAGGPGQAASELFPLVQGAFFSILATRDVLLVDQRGTGGSAPLHCANVEAWELRESMAASADDVVAATLECLAALEDDPRWFTTSAAVRDLEQVRAALGYERLNLYAASYGTRVAQHYLRRYPERTRSVILDGVVPPSLALGPDIALNSQAALDALFARCAEDAACGAAFAELPARLGALLGRLDAAPPELTFPHPLTGATVTMQLSRNGAAAAIRLLLYTPDTMSLLPALLDQAFAERYQPLAAQLVNMASSIGSLAYGLNFAVLCTEDVPFWGAVDVDAQRRTYMGNVAMDVQRRVCAAWPQGFMDADLKAPLATDVPALLLSGEFDPITPPSYAQRAGAGFARGTHVIGQGQGHGLVGSGCVPRLMAAFITNAADPEWKLDTSCMESLIPAPLFASPMGPGP